MRSSLIGLTVFLLVALLVLMVLAWVLRQVVKAVRGRRPKPASADRCRCGYELSNLELIRCPECGKVFGFSATPEELGLSEEELRRAAEARERRAKAKTEQQSR